MIAIFVWEADKNLDFVLCGLTKFSASFHFVRLPPGTGAYFSLAGKVPKVPSRAASPPLRIPPMWDFFRYDLGDRLSCVVHGAVGSACGLPYA